MATIEQSKKLISFYGLAERLLTSVYGLLTLASSALLAEPSLFPIDQELPGSPSFNVYLLRFSVKVPYPFVQ